MTLFDFIASLPHGEAKAAAVTVYNLMIPAWVEITEDPATLPEIGRTVIVRTKCAIFLENHRPEVVGWYEGLFPDTGGQRWYISNFAYWSGQSQTMEPRTAESCMPPPTHWRPTG